MKEGLDMVNKKRKDGWKELADFMIGKKIKRVEKWTNSITSTPTLIFENGDIVEFYVVNGEFGWVLTNTKEIEKETKS